MQNYQIFLNKKSLTFVKSIDSVRQNCLDDVKIFEISSLSNVNISLFFDEKETSNWILICGEQIDSLFLAFKKSFKLIYAAGGLVESFEKDILFIFRNGVWDLPKGKVEKGEDFMTAAVREVEEECGIKTPVVEQKLTETYHIYMLNNEYILKEAFWYKMKSDKKQKLSPQLEEGITKAEWISKENMFVILGNTYPNIKLLIERYL